MCFWNTLIWNICGSYPGSNSKRDSQNFVELYGFVVSRVESSQTGNSRFRLTRLSGFQVFRLAAERRGEAEVVLICRHNEWRSAVSRGDKRSWRGRGESCSTDFSDFSSRQSGRWQAAKGSSGLQQDPCFLHLGRDNSWLWSKMWEDRDQDSSEKRLKSRHLEDAGATKIIATTSAGLVFDFQYYLLCILWPLLDVFLMLCVLWRMLVKEYRIPLPLTVEEYRIGENYWHKK